MAEKRPNRTLGPGHDEFWAHCAKSELRFQKCNVCGHVNWPAVSICDECGSKDQYTWVRSAGRGTIMSWCQFDRPYYGDILPIPWDTILVKLAEGPIFLSNPKGFKYEDIDTGMPVKVAFIDCEDKAGPFKLPVFERA